MCLTQITNWQFLILQILSELGVKDSEFGFSKLPIRKREANTIAHLDGRCVKVHGTAVCNILNRYTLILYADPYEFTLTRTLYHSDRSLEHKVRKP